MVEPDLNLRGSEVTLAVDPRFAISLSGYYINNTF